MWSQQGGWSASGWGQAAAAAGGAPLLSLDFTTGTLPGAVTFTRASSGSRVNSSGVIVSEATDVARFNYDPVALTIKGLLIEPAATNLEGNSLTVQGGNAQGPTAAQGTAPDGANALVKLTGGNTTGSHYSYFNPVSQTPGSVYCTSFWVKAGGGANGRYIALRGACPTSPNLAWVVFDTTNKTITANGQVIASGYEDFGAIFRVWLTYTATGNESPLISIHDSSTVPAVTDGIPAAFTSTTSDFIYFWGLQIELGSKPTAYIATTSTAVTRSADNASFTIPGSVTGLRYTFDDNSTQDVSVSPGAYNVPTNLNRANIKSVRSWPN